MNWFRLILMFSMLISYALQAQPANINGKWETFAGSLDYLKLEDWRNHEAPAIFAIKPDGTKSICTKRSNGEWKSSGGLFLRWIDDNTFTAGPELVTGTKYHRAGNAPANSKLGSLAEGYYTWKIHDGSTRNAKMEYADGKQTVHLRKMGELNVVYATFKLEPEGYRFGRDKIWTDPNHVTLVWEQANGEKHYMKKFTPSPTASWNSTGSGSAAASGSSGGNAPPPTAAGATSATPAQPSIDGLNETTKQAKIHTAVQSEDYDEVDELIKKNANVNVREGNKNRTALHYSAMKNSSDIAGLLIQNDADMNLKDSEGKTALDIALERGNFKTAKVLLKANANAGLATAGLDRVLKTNETELLVLMLQNGANANTAANKAVEFDNVEMLNTILDNSTARATNQMFEKAVALRSQETALELLVRGIDKDQAMDYVIKKKDKTMVGVVLGMNASVSSTNKALVFAAEERDMALATTAIDDFNANPTAGMAPAVKNNHVEMVGFLLLKGADPNDQMDEASGNGQTVIVDALLNNSANPDLGIVEAATNDHIATLQVLLDASGDANLAMPIAIEKGNTQMVNMCIAAPKAADVYRTEYMVSTCEKSNLDILNALLLAGADPNPGMPISVGKKDAELVRELIGAGARVDRPEYLNKSAELKDAVVAKLLLEAGADPNSAMLISIELEDAPLVELMLEHRADGKPAHYISKASELGNAPIVDLLLGAGANANDGMAPAVNMNRTEVVSSLLKHGADGSKDMYMSSSAKHNNAALTGMLITAGGNPRTGLEPAIEANADKVVALLNDNGVEITDTEYLVTCVRKNHVATARVLVNAGASAAAWWDEGKGQGLLHMSIMKHTNADMAGLLIKAGADVNKYSSSGDSPMHVAVMNGKNKPNECGAVVQVLIAAGGDVNALNAQGETVLKAAPGKKAIRKPLKDAGAKKKL